jgi:hypothetical protein
MKTQAKSTFEQLKVSAITIGGTPPLLRKGFDTPYINRNDTRMTPQTFSAVALQGTAGGAGQPAWTFGAGYFDAEKARNSDEFESMARVAGAKVDRGVFASGATYKNGPVTLGAIDYYSPDIINIAYTETKYAVALANRIGLRFGAQYTSQRSIGEDLLTGHPFSTDQYGLKGELVLGSALLTLAYTGTGSGANMQSPWG